MRRPLSDARCARHPTPRPGAVPCGTRSAHLSLRRVRKTRAARATPRHAHAPSPGTNAACAKLQPVHSARRVERGVGCLAQHDAMRRASHSGGCGGPAGTQAGRHTRRDRWISLRKLPARRTHPQPSVARRASSGVEAPRSAVGAQDTWRTAQHGRRAADAAGDSVTRNSGRTSNPTPQRTARSGPVPSDAPRPRARLPHAAPAGCASSARPRCAMH